MVFLGIQKVNDEKAKVMLIHNRPDDLTEEEKSKGVLVESIPEPEKRKGYVPKPYINPETKEFWWEYEKTEEGELRDRLEATEEALLELLLKEAE